MDKANAPVVAAALRLIRRRLDPDVCAGLEGADFARKLRDYLRGRQGAEVLFLPERIEHIAARAEALDPRESAWERRIADEAVEGRLYAASNPHAESFLAVDRNVFDFRTIRHFDPEAIHGLNRCRWLACLARQYWLNRSTRYFDALVREWDFYVEKVPFRDDLLVHGVQRIDDEDARLPTYHDLNGYIRLMNWYWAYWLSLWASEMTPERHAVLLARCLRLFDAVAARPFRMVEHNKFTMQMEPLYLWASALPEFTGMPLWKESARRWLETSLMAAVWEDGAQWEKSADYHIGCIRWYGVSYIAGQRWGERWHEKYGPRLRAMGEYLDALVTPEGRTPLLSDSDRTEGWRGALALIRAAFPDMKFQRPIAPSYASLWVSDGAEWDARNCVGEKARVTVFPCAGVAVARASGRTDAALVILDNGPTRAGHAHKANLTVHFDALGRPILVDPGRWIYDGRDPDRVWVQMPWSHNTVIPEETPISADTPAARNPLPIISTPGDNRIGPTSGRDEGDILRLCSRITGFTGESQAVVCRTVAVCSRADAPWMLVADRIESPSEQVWTNAWLIPGTEPIEPAAGGWRATLDAKIGLGIAALDAEAYSLRDEARFWCPNYAVKSPARWVRFSRRCARSLRAFAFAPVRGRAAIPRLRMEGSVIVVETDQGEWRLALDAT